METEQDISPDEGLADGPDENAPPATAGEMLRAAREERRLSLDHVAAETRIPIRHLETLEVGDYEALPSRTYAIGFARNYARAVGLDETLITDLVREELGNAGTRYGALSSEMEPGDPAKLPSSGLAWFGGLAALILVIGVVAFASSYFGAGEGPGSLLAGSEADEEAVASAQGATEANAPAPAAPSAGGQVVFTALEDGVWVRFYEEGGDRLFEAQMASGDTFELPQSASEPRINTGRPDAFAITIDGREVPKLSEEPVTMGDTPISAAALLARPRT